MRAVVMRNKRLVVTDLPRSRPGAGRGAGQDAGLRDLRLGPPRAPPRRADGRASRRAGSVFTMDLARDVVMGHEFCAEVVDHGAEHDRARSGPATRVCSLPILIRADGQRTVGYSNDMPGGYAELHAADRGAAAPGAERAHHRARRAHRADGGGLHAVAKARLEPDDAPLVIGCGPVGLAVIAALRLRGARRSWPPTSRPAGGSWRRAGRATSWWIRRETPCRAGARPRSTPEPRAVRRRGSGAGGRPAVVFECVGVPGVLDQLMRASPRGSAHRRRRRVHGGRHDPARCSASARS